MSKYRMPLLINNDRSKQLQKKIQKYKLPILINEPLQQHQYSINNTTSQIIKIQKIKDINNIQDNQHGQRNLQRNQRAQNLSTNRKSINNLSTIQRYNQVDNKDKIINDQENQLQSSIENIKSQIKNQRNQYNSSYQSNRYSTKNRFDDKETSILALQQQIQKDMPPKQTKRLKLPSIIQKTQQKVSKQLHIQLWNELFEYLQKHHKPQKKKKRLKSFMKMNDKRSKTQMKKRHNTQSYRQCRLIQQQLKKMKTNDHTSNYQYNNSHNNISLQKIKINNGTLLHRNNTKDEHQQDNNVAENVQKILNNINYKNKNNNIRSKSKQMRPSIQFYINSYQQIKTVNPFFRKINQLGGCILLNIGTLTIVQSGKRLYAQGQQFSSIYILIYGKIILTDQYKLQKKIILTGETLGQQCLFQNDKSYNERLKNNQKQYNHKYQAKVVNKSCLLSFQLSKYYKVCRQLNKMGYKSLFNLIDNLLRINYINKQNYFSSNKRKLITQL